MKHQKFLTPDELFDHRVAQDQTVQRRLEELAQLRFLVAEAEKLAVAVIRAPERYHGYAFIRRLQEEMESGISSHI